MSTVAIIILVVLAYIMQVLLVLVYPYYRYRQNHKEHKDKTIGSFVKFTNAVIGEIYIFIATLPFVGFILIALIFVVELAIIGMEAFYNKFIKDIKI